MGDHPLVLLSLLMASEGLLRAHRMWVSRNVQLFVIHTSPTNIKQ